MQCVYVREMEQRGEIKDGLMDGTPVCERQKQGETERRGEGGEKF